MNSDDTREGHGLVTGNIIFGDCSLTLGRGIITKVSDNAVQLEGNELVSGNVLIGDPVLNERLIVSGSHYSNGDVTAAALEALEGIGNGTVLRGAGTVLLGTTTDPNQGHLALCAADGNELFRINNNHELLIRPGAPLLVDASRSTIYIPQSALPFMQGNLQVSEWTIAPLPNGLPISTKENV